MKVSDDRQEHLDKTLEHVFKAMDHFSLTLLHIEDYGPTHRHLSEAYHALKTLGAKYEIE